MTGAGENLWQSDTVDAVTSITPGFYTIVVRGDSHQNHDVQIMHFVASSAGAITTTPATGPGSIFVFDKNTGQPLSNSELSAIVDSTNPAERHLLPTTKTDANGLAPLPPLSSTDERHRDQELCLLANEQPLLVTRSAGNDILNDELSHTVDLFVDRKLFRPGDTVHWKVIARDWSEGRFIIPVGKPKMSVRLSPRIDSGIPLYDAELSFDSFGTTHGEFKLPQTARSGTGYMTLDWPDIKKSSHRLLEPVDMFRVDNYVPPAIKADIELVGPPNSLRPGQTISVRSKARYLSGGLVSGCPVVFKLNASNYNEQSLTKAQQRQFEGWQQELKDHPLNALTDAAGNTEIRLYLPNYVLPDTRLTIETTLSPEGGQPVKANARWLISPAGVNVVNTDTSLLRFVRPGETVTFSFLARNGCNLPYRFDGVAQLVERKWYEAWLDPSGTLISGDKLGEARRQLHLGSTESLPQTWKKMHADYIEMPLSECQVKSGEDGQIKVPFLIPHSGLYTVQLKVDGQACVASESNRRYENNEYGVIAADEKAILELRPDATLLIGPELLRENEPLRLLAILPEGKHWALVAINGDDHAVIRRVAVANRVGFLDTTDLPRFTGKGTATIVALEKPSSAQDDYASASFQVSTPARLIDIALNTSGVEARPGDTVTIGFWTKNSAANPATAQIAFAVTDQAVNQLSADLAQSKEPFHSYSRVVSSVPGHDGQKEEPNMIEDISDDSFSEESAEQLTHIKDPRPGAFFCATPLAMKYLTSNSRDEWLAYTQQILAPAARLGAGMADQFAMQDRDFHIRTHFDSTAFWTPDLVTNEKGEATVSFKYPDNLTQWRLEAYAVGADGNSFGRAATFTRTSLPFQTRLQLPRFLVAGDTAEPSALLLNRTDTGMVANAELKLNGPIVASDPTQPIQNGITVPKQSEAHAAWSVHAKDPGSAEFTLTGRAGSEGDAMILPLPILEDGIQQQTAAAGRLAPQAKKTELKLDLPKPLDPQRTHVTVQLSPSHASVVLDAMPYLVDYPYGCVEQTISRFLPAVIVQKTLADLGLDAAAVEQRIQVGESPADSKRRSGTAGLTKLDDVVQQGLGRLIEAKRYDGGFGWWPGAQSTNLWMTAYVAWGLGIAKSAGISVPDRLEKDTWRALAHLLPNENRATNEVAWALAALTEAKFENDESAKTVQATFARVFVARDQLSATGRACLAQASVKFGDAAQRAILLRNLENGAEQVQADDFGNTVHWGKTSHYWSAMDGAVETTSLTLLALLELDPKHPLIEPAVNWLVLNRRSSHWQSTRDSALAVLALTRYIAQRHELDSDLEAEVFVSGKSIGRVVLNRDSVLKGTTTLEVPAALLRPGVNPLTVKRLSGTGPLYAVALASAWATGDAVKPAGYMVDVTRGFIRQKAEPTLIGTLRITQQPLLSGGSAVSGEQVTAKVTLTVPNDLEYIMIEVPKPAGCEPLNPLSGWDAKIRRLDKDTPSTKEEEEGHPVYREERDDKSVFFLDRLEAGTWEIRFGMRAVTPGDFRALPVQATAMYVPEITANSDAQRLKIQRAE